MKPQTKKRLIIYTSIAAILGVGGYLAYTKIIKPYLDKRKGAIASEENPSSPINSATSSAGSSTDDKLKTQVQMKGEAISRGDHAYRYWDANLSRYRCFTTGKNASNGLSIKPDVEIFPVVPLPPATSKGAIKNFQTFLNSIGASLVDDGNFGLKTANSSVKFVNKMKQSGNGWKLSPNQRSIITA